MNILSISQLQTQTTQADFSQGFESRRDYDEKPTFADFLRDAKQASESTESAKSAEKTVPEESEKIAKDDAASSAEKNLKEAEKNPSESEKSEKIARKASSESKKNEEQSKNLEESQFDDGNFISVSLNQIQNARTIVETEQNFEVEPQRIVLGEETPEISDNMLSWLMSSANIEDRTEDISDADFAKMIDAAVEFIPGFESESEKLENAQNLALSDPEFFLDAVENAQFAEISARGAAKSEVDFVDSGKKIASEKTAEKKGAKLSVHDLRTHHLFDEDSAKIASDKIVQKSAEKKEINLSMQKQADGNLQMTMELASRAQENITSSSAQAAGANGSDFQAMLSNAVQENAPDFVKAGNIVLKDNNQGTINLVLRPEGLGNVKISLNLDDKNLSAQITVQTKEAMEAFRESISSLKQAFTESGFETGSFDLNFSQNQNQQGFAQGGNDGQNQNAGILAHKSYGDFVTASAISADAADAFAGGEYSVNIVA